MNYPPGMIPALGALPRRSGTQTLTYPSLAPDRQYHFPAPKSAFASASEIRDQIRADLSRIGEVGEIVGQIDKHDGSWRMVEVFAFVEGRMVECRMAGDRLVYRYDREQIDLSLFPSGYDSTSSGSTIPSILGKIYTELHEDPKSLHKKYVKRKRHLLMRERDLHREWGSFALGVVLGYPIVVILLLAFDVDFVVGLGEIKAGIIWLVVAFLGILIPPLRVAVASIRLRQVENAPGLESFAAKYHDALEKEAQRMCEIRNIEYLGGMEVKDGNDELARPVPWKMFVQFGYQKPGDRPRKAVSNGFHLNA